MHSSSNQFLLQRIIDTCTFFSSPAAFLPNNNEEADSNKLAAQFVEGGGSILKPQKSEQDSSSSSSSSSSIKIFNQDAISVSMSERKQRDITAHCGARTLFVGEKQQSADEKDSISSTSSFFPILARGANKFFDLQNAFHQIVSNNNESSDDPNLSSSSSSSSSLKILPQRKSAGFFCMFFSDSASSNVIRCASKHSLSGKHVDVALSGFRHAIKNNTATEKKIASFLFKNNYAMLCECVLDTPLAFGLAHPTIDYDIQSSDHPTIVWFALQDLTSKVEKSVPLDEIQKIKERKKLPFQTSYLIRPEYRYVTAGQDESRFDSSSISKCVFEMVLKAAQTACPPHWSLEPNANILLSEGAVLLLENREEEEEEKQTTAVADTSSNLLIRPIRLKIKTAMYQLLRHIRSIINNPNTLVSSSKASILQQERYFLATTTPLAISILCWLLNRSRISSSTNAAVQNLERNLESGLVLDPAKKIQFKEWESVFRGFLCDVQINTDEQHAACTLLNLLDLDASRRYRVQLLNGKFIILLSGLPGSGKSSFSKALKAKLEELYNNDKNDGKNKIRVSIIERDAFVPALPPGSSNHAQRAARKAAHRGFIKALRSGVSSSSTSAEDDDENGYVFLPDCPQVIIADACHASAGARQTTRESLGPYRFGLTCHFHCADRKQLVKRVLQRKDHQVLPGGGANQVDVVEKAIFDVASAFEYPTQEECGRDGFVKFSIGSTSNNNKALATEDMVSQVLEKTKLQLAIDGFFEDMKQVEKLDRKEDHLQHISQDLIDQFNKDIRSFDFFRRTFFINKSSSDDTSVHDVADQSSSLPSSIHDVLVKCSPPPSLLSIQLIPAKRNEEWKNTLEKILRRTLQRLQSDGNNKESNLVVAGHTKWIEPYFGKATTASSSTSSDTASSLFDRIQRRFLQATTSSTAKPANAVTEDVIIDSDNLQLHVTLHHSKDFPFGKIPEETTQKWIRKENNDEQGSLFKIKPTRIAIDRQICVVKVEIEEIMVNVDDTEDASSKSVANDHQEESKQILHITFSHSSKAQPSQALDLLKREETTTSVDRESGKRRDREENEEETKNSDDAKISKTRHRKQNDSQFCIMKIDNEKEGDAHDDDGTLFGIVQCLAK